VGHLASIAAENVEIDAEEAHLWGYTDVSTPEGVRIQADEIHYVKATHILWAEGNVVLDVPGLRLTGSRLDYDVKTETGTLLDVYGWLEPDAILTAHAVEKIAADRIRVRQAVFTSCTQPTPYWSFHIARGEFHLKHYAYLHSLSMRIRGVPVFYTPFLVWPIKERRATGFLFPQFGQSDTLGRSVSLPFFWAMARNADLTLFFDGYTKVGPALGTELNWLPSRRGKAQGIGYYINDRVKEKERFKLGWKQHQRIGRGWRLVGDLNFVSDFDYYTEYERDLQAASTPVTLSRIDLNKSWSYYSLNARAEAREQFFVGGIETRRALLSELDQRLLPEVEFRGRSRRIGPTPLFLSFETSASRFQRESITYYSGGGGYDQVWERFDVFPSIKLPWSPVPWLDIQPVVGYRQTWYSKRWDPDAPDQLSDESLQRSLFQARLEVQGPKLVRIWDAPRSRFSPRYKHTIEPFLTYRYTPEPSTDPTEILRFDEIDVVEGARNEVTYGIRQRLFALRPAQVGSRTREEERAVFRGLAQPEREPDEDELAETRRLQTTPVREELNPVEVISLSISQRYSFLEAQALSRAYAILVDEEGNPRTREGSGVVWSREVDTRPYSPIDVALRFNADMMNSVDVRYSYDPLLGQLAGASVSGSIRDPDLGYLRLSWYRANYADPARVRRDQVRLFGGIQAFNRKVGLEVEWNYDLEDRNMVDQRYRARYYTQCCGFVIEYLRRDFLDNERREMRLTVDLRGIGKFLDLHQGFGGEGP
jgi:LPS-assembly protein